VGYQALEQAMLVKTVKNRPCQSAVKKRIAFA